MPFQKTNPMSRRALLPLIAATALSPALFVPSAVRAQGAVWQIYRRDDLGFEIDMPGKPKIEVEEFEREVDHRRGRCRPNVVQRQLL